MIVVLAAALLAAAPGPGAEELLRVRILERHRPTHVAAVATAVWLDGRRQTPTGVRFQVAGDKLQVEGGPALSAIDLVFPQLTVERVQRTYRGVVHARARDGAIELINEVALEDYLASVVGSETVTHQAEALKAQAVVSRTFALASLGRHRGAGHDLCDLAHCQVYAGVKSEREASRKAAEATKGQVLLRGASLEPAWFHSSCGGATSHARDVFGGGAAGDGVGDLDEQGEPLCAASPDATWTFALTRDELARALGVPAQGRALEVARKDRAGRIVQVRAFGARMSGDELQSRVGRALGWHRLKSLLAEVDEQSGAIRFRGRGLGHGVGLCQWGAAALAAEGQGYRQILGRYFPGTRVERR